MKLKDVKDFARHHGQSRIFTEWTDSEVLRHLELHRKNKTLLVAEGDEEILGFFIFRRIEDFNGDVTPHFWKPSEPYGKNVYVHELCSKCRNATNVLLHGFEAVNSDSEKVNYWAHRKNILKKYSYKDFRRLMIWENQNHQKNQI